MRALILCCLFLAGCPFFQPAPPSYGGHIVCRAIPVLEEGETKQVIFCEIAIEPKDEDEGAEGK